LRPGISVSLTDSLRLDAEIAVSNESQSSDNVSFGSVFDRTLHTVSFTPRLRWQHGLGGLESATTAGIDYYYGRVSSDSTTYASQNADQASRAVYLQNSTRFDQHWSTTVGVRSQNMRQHADQDAYAPFLMPAFRGSSERTVNVYDLGVRYQADAWSAYAKTGTNMRFANTDELFGFDPFTGNPVFAGGLKPQRGRAHEIGGAFKLGTANARLALYRMNLRDEIGFDSVTFANVNFDPTRHEGLEAEMDWRIADDWRALLNYARTVAKFREGPYQDNDIPMVARDKAGVQLAWNGHRLGNYSAQVNYVGPRYFSGDYANARERLSGYTTLDLHANWDLKPLQLNAMVINALDKHYAPYALYSNTFSDYYYFPADSRTFYLSARYDFK
jgi:iron complex outermembrane receptor protein